MCLILDESTNRDFHRGRTDVCECLNSTADYMYSIPDPILDDGSFIEYFVQLPHPFMDSVPEDGKAHLITHAVWNDMEDREAISILSASTKPYPLGIWMCIQVYLIDFPCDVIAWNTLTRFIADAGGGLRSELISSIDVNGRHAHWCGG